MRNRYKFLVVLCLLCSAVQMSLRAQDTLKLDLKQVLELGLSTSPTIKIADKQLKRVDYSNKEKYAALFPNIVATGSYQRALKKQRMFFNIPGAAPNPDGFEIGQDNTFVGGVSATLPIIAPTLWATVKMNQADMQLVAETARASKIDLLNQLTKTYYSILYSQDSYKVFESNYKNSAQSAQVIANKYKLGAVSEFEWLRADVQLRSALTNVISAESAIEMSKLQLKTLIGLDLNTQIEIVGSLKEFEKNMYAEVLSVDKSQLTNNSDLQQLDIRTEQMKRTLDVQRASWFPTLGASINYQYMAMANDDVKIKNYSWFPNSNAALSLNIPIFQGGARYFKGKQLKLQMEEIGLQKQNLKNSIELQANTYIVNMKKLIDKIESNKKGLQQAEKAVAISTKMYEVGAATFLDQSNSELALLQAGLAYNQSVFDFLSTKADLEKLLGNTFSN